MKTKRDFTHIIKAANYKYGIEVGVREGNYLRWLVENTNLEMCALDPWDYNAENTYPDSSYKSVLGIKEKYPNRVVIFRDYSPKAAEHFLDSSFDFIYIDALHDYESVKKDLNAWWPKLRQSGLFAGHDFNRNSWPGVVKAVEEFMQDKNKSFYLTTEPDDEKELSWYTFK